MTRQIEATTVWRIRQRKPQRGRRRGKGRGSKEEGEGRLSSAAAPHGALRQLLDEKQTPRGICHAPHTGGGLRMVGGQRETSCLAGFYFYLFSFFCCCCCFCTALVLFAVKGSETRVRVNKRNARTTGSIFRVVCVYFYQALQRFNPNLWDLLAVIVVRVLLSLSLSHCCCCSLWSCI